MLSQRGVTTPAKYLYSFILVHRLKILPEFAYPDKGPLKD